jgi:uncharacterized protein
MTTRFPLPIVLTVLCALSACGDPNRRVAPAADQATKVEELRALAEQGNAADQFNLGVAYERGQGVSQDYQEAMRWYRLAAMQGDSAAQYKLCVMSDKGVGVPQDYQEALRWCRLAADQGQERAMYILGLYYHKALGVSQDLVRAHMWYNLAAAHGYQDGAKSRDRLAQLLTPAEIAEAQKLAREWKPKDK